VIKKVCFRIVIGKLHEGRISGRFGCIWEVNIQIDLKEIDSEDVNWMRVELNGRLLLFW
jgi:hypothetical protein